jgi:hypothetical protein
LLIPAGLIRPEELRIAAAPNGNGIVTIATFLGSLTRAGPGAGSARCLAELV